MTKGSRLRCIAYGICALLTAACGDVLVEALQNANLFGADAIDASHQGVAPVLALATLALCVLGTVIARDRLGISNADGDDWLARLALELSYSALRVHLAAIVGSALALVCVIEEYERGFGGALPFDGAHATPGETAASLAVYIVCAAVITCALSHVMHALAATCNAFARIVTIFATLLERIGSARASRLGPSRREFARRPFLRLSGPFGDRAPPLDA